MGILTKICASALVLSCALISFSQDKSGKESYHVKPETQTEIERTKDFINTKKGTFQFILQDGAPKPLFNVDLVALIKTSRLQSEDVYVQYNERTTIFLPSKDKLNSTDFEEMQTYLYVNGNNEVLINK